MAGIDAGSTPRNFILASGLGEPEGRTIIDDTSLERMVAGLPDDELPD